VTLRLLITGQCSAPRTQPALIAAGVMTATRLTLLIALFA
jgi:hypothetical protein